jgi:hypothetical protein
MLKSFNFPGIVTPTNLGGNEEVMDTFFFLLVLFADSGTMDEKNYGYY